MEYIKEGNRYYVLDGTIEIGEVTYSIAGDELLILDHTFVEPEYRGQGIAEHLVKLVVDQAIAEDKKIIPLCPFAAREFKNKPAYRVVQKV